MFLKSENRFRKFFSTALFLAFVTFAGCGNQSGKTPEAPKEEAKEAAKQKIDVAKYDQKYNDLALFLAGMQVTSGSKLAKLTEDKGWQDHQKVFADKWAQFRKDRLDSVEIWQKAELSSFTDKAKTVFYPFGGPDFFFAYEFFPDAHNYILQGLEPVYQLPDSITFNNTNLGAYLLQLQNSLNVLLKGGYFITKEMNRDFNVGILRGVIPVMLLFMAKTDHTVLDVQYIYADGDGNFLLDPADLSSGNNSTVKKQSKLPTDIIVDPKPQGNAAAKKSIKGVKITFTDSKKEQIKNLYYFSTDTQNPSWDARKSLQDLVLSMKPLIFFTKAASYLLHGQDFGNLRNFILDNCDYFLQTDTGIPLRYFKKDVWDITFYGSYTKPIDTFRYAFQQDLRDIYKDPAKVKHLPFGICYNWEKGTSNMFAGVKKK